MPQTSKTGSWEGLGYRSAGDHGKHLLCPQYALRLSTPLGVMAQVQWLSVEVFVTVGTFSAGRYSPRTSKISHCASCWPCMMQHACRLHRHIFRLRLLQLGRARTWTSAAAHVATSALVVCYACELAACPDFRVASWHDFVNVHSPRGGP